MKGMSESMMKILIGIIIGGIFFMGIIYILNYFGVSLWTPLCRTFCFPLSSFAASLLRSIFIGYLMGAPGSTMCSFCG